MRIDPDRYPVLDSDSGPVLDANFREPSQPARQAQVEQSPLYSHKPHEEENPLDAYEVCPSRVRLGALIGSGAFGRVHAAELLLPGGSEMVVAAKMLNEDALPEEMSDFLREIVMLKRVGTHKHVIRLVACCTQRAPFMALLEHAPRGDLLTLLRTARGKNRKISEVEDTRRTNSEDVESGRPSESNTEYTTFSDSDPTLECKVCDLTDHGAHDHGAHDHYVAEPALRLDGATMREYALQVALGMSHLEKLQITHRDLAARNILVDGAGVLKVADFGLSRSGVYVHSRARPVPLRWLAPEAIVHSQYSSATDVWAYAVLLWEIATLGGFPYAELSNYQVPPFLSGGGRLPKPARASQRLYELMVTCWNDDPSKRPTFELLVAKLKAQQKLYVDLDNVFTNPDEDYSISDMDFEMKSNDSATS